MVDDCCREECDEIPDECDDREPPILSALDCLPPDHCLCTQPNGLGVIPIFSSAALAVSAALRPVILQASSATNCCSRGAYFVALGPKWPMAAAAHIRTAPLDDSRSDDRSPKVLSSIFVTSALRESLASSSAAEPSPARAFSIKPSNCFANIFDPPGAADTGDSLSNKNAASKKNNKEKCLFILTSLFHQIGAVQVRSTDSVAFLVGIF